MFNTNKKDPFGNGYIKGGKTMNNFKLRLYGVIGGLSLVVLLFAAFQFVGFVEVKGHQAAVVEKFYGEDRGVQGYVLGPGRHFYIPLLEKPYVYNIGTDNFIMGKNRYYTGKGTDYVDFKALTIKCGGRGQEQPATFSVTLQYQLDRAKLTNLHVSSQKQYKDRIIKPALTNIIKNLTVEQHVLNFYTGKGYNNLQKSVEKMISTDKTLSNAGIVVNTFVIDQIDLDPAYEREIQERQLATQQKLKEDELAKAAQAAALKEEAIANADKLKRIVGAEASKQERIKAAEAEKQERQLKAEALALEIKEKAAAKRFEKEQNAIALKKEGLARAAVDKARKMSRYEGEAGRRQAAVEIAHANVEKFQNFNPKGVITEKTFLSVLNSHNDTTSGPIVTIEANK